MGNGPFDLSNITPTRRHELDLQFTEAQQGGPATPEQIRSVSEGRDAVLTAVNGKSWVESLEILTEALVVVTHESGMGDPMLAAQMLVAQYRRLFPESDAYDPLADILGLNDDDVREEDSPDGDGI